MKIYFYLYNIIGLLNIVIAGFCSLLCKFVLSPIILVQNMCFGCNTLRSSLHFRYTMSENDTQFTGVFFRRAFVCSGWHRTFLGYFLSLITIVLGN